MISYDCEFFCSLHIILLSPFQNEERSLMQRESENSEDIDIGHKSLE